MLCLSLQMEKTLKGKVITQIVLGDSSKSLIKQGMCNLNERSGEILNTPLKSIKNQGKWIFLEFKNGKFLLLGEIIGKFIYHLENDHVPSKFHILFKFQDGTFLTFHSSLYAFLLVADKKQLEEHKYAGNQGLTPISGEFTYDYFADILSRYKNRGIKGVLNLQSEISGLGNAYINDILYQAQIHPKTKVYALDEDKKKKIYQCIISTINQAVKNRGSSSEYDLFGKKGNYIRIMDRKTENMKCERCGVKIVKMNVLGSSSYLCPECQKL
ncbi:zinc finger domain-containing protein [Methanobacterium sp.]|uniref:zinc finger domain-containing protein n=1 Tax=Methanobacterium sp. TaxID=2164 RepID=UPI00338DB5B5